MEIALWAYEHPLTNVAAFKYIFLIITTTDNGCPASVAKLRKDRKKLAQMSRILGREGSNA